MSRKGKLPIQLPKGVEVKVSQEEIQVKGPKGTLHQKLVPGVVVAVENGHVQVSLAETHQSEGRLHGLYRTLIANMVDGTNTGFNKELEMIGVGYRAAVQGHLIDLSIGLSHPTKLEIPKGIHVKIEKGTQIQITGIDKQLVGEFAATIRSKRPPEPYQGKGIRYKNEYVRRKAGKSASAKK